MPGRLIVFIITLLVIVTFIGFNMENSSDIRVWFGENGLLTDVPIFVSFFVMYLIGVLSVIPFMLGWRFKHRKSKTVDEEMDEAPDKEKKQKNVRILGGGKKRRKDTEAAEASEQNGESETDEGSPAGSSEDSSVEDV